MKTEPIKILSFFTGGGFLDMGFESNDFEIVWTNENDIVISNLYEIGYQSWLKSISDKEVVKPNNLSICELSTKTILKESFGNSIPEIFGVIGGPPCQDFSLNGRKDGFHGERGNLTKIFFDKIIQLNASFFVMENVSGLVRMGKYKLGFVELLNLLKKKYYVDINILNSLDFGVPQYRERVFIVGFNKSHYSIDLGTQNGKWFHWPKNEMYEGALLKYNWPKSKTFGTDSIKPKEIPIELCVQSCLVSSDERKKIPNGEEYFQFKKPKMSLRSIREGETNRPSFRRLHRYRFSPTTCYGNNEVHLHPYENRRLSLREGLRIQGIPDSYVLPSEASLTKKFKMVGNGVPYPLAREVAKSVKKFIKENGIYFK